MQQQQRSAGREVSVKYRNVTREEVKERMAEQMRRSRNDRRSAALDAVRGGGASTPLPALASPVAAHAPSPYAYAGDASPMPFAFGGCGAPQYQQQQCQQQQQHAYGNYCAASASVSSYTSYGAEGSSAAGPSTSRSLASGGDVAAAAELDLCPAERARMMAGLCGDYGLDPCDAATVEFLLAIEAEIRAEELFALQSRDEALDDPEAEYMYYMGLGQ